MYTYLLQTRCKINLKDNDLILLIELYYENKYELELH